MIADSGYQSRPRVEQLRTRGVRAAICRHRVRGQSQLPPGQRRYNRLIAPMRALVEHPLAWMKRRMAYRKVRYRGLTRNTLACDVQFNAPTSQFPSHRNHGQQ